MEELYEYYIMLKSNEILKEKGKSQITDKEENAIYSMIANIYYKTTGISCDILTEKELLYSWTKENSRFEALNYLIERTINTVMYNSLEQDETDQFIKNNLKYLLDIVLKQAKYCLMNKNEELTNLTKKRQMI